MRRGIAALAVSVLVVSASVYAVGGGPMTGGGPEAAATAVFYNGRIYTMDVDGTVAEAVAVADGRILYVGTSDGALAAAGPGAERFDLRGLTVIPGLVDAHAHFVGYAVSRAALDLRGTGSFEEVSEMVRSEVALAHRGRWITGRGWDQNDWDRKAFPRRSDIDPVSPGNPVLLTRVCGHAAIANSKALEAAGIGRDTPDPEGGKIERDQAGEPTGILFDEAVSLVRDVVPSLTREEKKKLMISAAQDCLAAGLTGTHEMGISSETAGIYRELYEAGELPFRITAYFDGDAEDLDSVLAAGPAGSIAGGMFSLAGVKFYGDGSLGARSAAMLEDYSDDPGNRGIIVTDPEVLYERISACHRSGFQVATHAIGDRANRMVLDIYERVLAEGSGAGLRHRVEHAQILSPVDIGRFAALGVIPSMQFTHCTSDMPWVADRIGEGRLAGAYAWRSLISAGSRIPGGSDYPVESIDPLLGIYAAVTRQGLDGLPEGGWMPEQRLTIEEAVRAFTLDAAWAAGQAGDRGSIEKGKMADLTILDADLMEAEPADIPGIEIVATVIAGRIEFKAEKAPF
jgi:predicted amidohydrolase YtcJ